MNVLTGTRQLSSKATSTIPRRVCTILGRCNSNSKLCAFLLAVIHSHVVLNVEFCLPGDGDDCSTVSSRSERFSQEILHPALDLRCLEQQIVCFYIPLYLDSPGLGIATKEHHCSIPYPAAYLQLSIEEDSKNNARLS